MLGTHKAMPCDTLQGSEYYPSYRLDMTFKVRQSRIFPPLDVRYQVGISVRLPRYGLHMCQLLPRGRRCP